MTGSTSCGQAPSFWRLCAVTFSKPLHETEASPIIQIFFINVLFTVPVIQINFFERIKANRFIKTQKYFLKELFKRKTRVKLEETKCTVSVKVWGPFYFEYLITHIKVSKFQNEFMKSSFLPKYEPNIVRIFALYCATLKVRLMNI